MARPERTPRSVALEAAIVARMYFIDGRQKNEIAERLRMSRFKVARLLDEARDAGIVRIQVELPSDLDLPAGEALAARYGIRGAVVARVLPGAEDALGAVLGSAAVAHLAGVLRDGASLGVSWGSTLAAVADAVDELPAVDVVQLVGGAVRGRMPDGGVELVRRLSEAGGGIAVPLHAPLVLRSADTARELRTEPGPARAFAAFERLDVALVGVGSWQPPSSSLYEEFEPEDRDGLLAQGAAADICSIVLAADGAVLRAPALDRTLGIGEAELRRVPEVVAVAGGDQKVAALEAALRSGLIDTLVTDSTTAAALLGARDGARGIRA